MSEKPENADSYSSSSRRQTFDVSTYGDLPLYFSSRFRASKLTSELRVPFPKRRNSASSSASRLETSSARSSKSRTCSSTVKSRCCSVVDMAANRVNAATKPHLLATRTFSEYIKSYVRNPVPANAAAELAAGRRQKALTTAHIMRIQSGRDL